MFTTCTPNQKCKPWVAGKRCQSFLGPRRVGVASRWRVDFLGHGIYINLLQIYFEHLRQSWHPSEFCDKCDKWDVRQSSVIHNMKKSCFGHKNPKTAEMWRCDPRWDKKLDNCRNEYRPCIKLTDLWRSKWTTTDLRKIAQHLQPKLRTQKFGVCPGKNVRRNVYQDMSTLIKNVGSSTTVQLLKFEKYDVFGTSIFRVLGV